VAAFSLPLPFPLPLPGAGEGVHRRLVVHPGVVEERHDTGREVVLGTDDRHLAGFDGVLEDVAAAEDRAHRAAHVQVGHVLDERRVLRIAGGSVERLVLLVHGRLDLREQVGEVAEFHVIAGALDGAALRVPHHHDELRAGDVAGELEAAHDVGVHDVAGDPHREDVAEALVEDELRRRAAVDAAHDGGKGPLAVACLVGLLQQVAVDPQVVDETCVAFLQDLEGAGGCDGGLRFERVCVFMTIVLCSF
jgi:hypothetical protein